MGDIQFKDVEKYLEEECGICGEYDWGEFMVLENGDRVCPECLNKIKKAIQIKEFSKSLD
ncbi:MAG: hypothetical protein RR942_01420 [Romboutsia sp.]